MAHWSDESTPATMPEQPWLHPAAIAYLKGILKSSFEVLEHGSGGSTIWFASKVKRVTCIEDKPEWFEAIKARNLKNVTQILHTEKGIPAGLGMYDLVFVDGEPVSNRAAYLHAARQLVKLGGWLVLDNYNNYKYIKQVEVLDKEFDNVKFNSRVGMYLNTAFYRIEEPRR